MTDCSPSHSVSEQNLRQNCPPVLTEADVLITPVLANRLARQPDLAAENQAFATLAQQLTDEPQSRLKTLIQISRDLQQADTVRVSLLETLADGSSMFRWVAIVGALESWEQITTPSNFSPCGTATRCGCPQLYSYPERYFTYLHQPQFPIVEGLLIPICVNDQTLGILWLFSHTEQRQFDREDLRLATSLTGFAAAALQSMHLRQMARLGVQAEQSLQESEAFNHSVFESSADCIKVLDLDGYVLSINGPGRCLMAVEDCTPLFGTAWIQFWQDADQANAAQAVKTAQAGGTGQFSGYCPTFKGTPKWWDVVVTPILDVLGKPKQLLVVSRDVSARKQTEQALQENEEQSRNILESISDAFLALDQNWQFTYVNPTAEALLGCASGSLTGKVLWEEFPGLDGSELEQLHRRVMRDRAAESLTAFYPDHDRWYEIRSYPAANGGITIYFTNVTDRKQVEIALHNSEEQFRNVADHAPFMVWVTDPSGYCTYLSQSWYDFTGQTPETGLGFGWLDRTHAEDRANAERIFLAANEQQQSFRLEYRLQSKHGDYIWAIDAASPWFGVDSEFKGYIGSVIDISDRKQAEVALQESEERYRTLFESIDEGFCVVEVLLDDHDAPIDYRVLEVNPIFEQQTGLHQAVGKTARQLNLEAHWIEIYGQVALTGESIRFENGSEALNRWFDVYACGTGEPQARKVAIVFRDISDRKRHEANLAFLANIAEDLSRLSSAHEIMQTVGAKLGAHLNLSHGLFAEIDAAQDRVVVEYAWNPSDAPDLIGVYQLSQFVTEEFQRAARAGETIVIRNTQTDVRTDANRYAAFNIHAFVSVPFHRNNEWKYLLTVNHAISRDWLEDEIELVRELANCVFPRLERARAEAIVAADLQDTKLLRELGARLTTEGDIQTLYQAILSTAIALTRADAGTVQILDEATQELVLLAAQGFEPTMLKHFYRLNESSNTPCAVALKNGRRSFVDFDVPESEHPDGVRQILTEAGYLSGQSTPLTTRSGKIIGMVSTQWRDHHRPSDRELRFLICSLVKRLT